MIDFLHPVLIAVLAAAVVGLGFAVSRLRARLARHGEEVDLMRAALEAKDADLAARTAEAEANASELHRFIYAVSHDLKSPLFSIEGFLGLLEKDLREGLSDRLEEDLHQLRTATGEFGLFLQELLEFSRIGRMVNPAQHVPLAELVHQALDLVEAKIAERCTEVIVAPDLPLVFGDRRRLLQVCHNLIDNAVRFTGSQEAPRIEIEAAERDGDVVCSVRDNGIGIDFRDHERIFRLFKTLDTESGGRGIGLALAKRIIEAHGGRIWVESTASGQGSAFFFTLPQKGGGLEGMA